MRRCVPNISKVVKEYPNIDFVIYMIYNTTQGSQNFNQKNKKNGEKEKSCKTTPPVGGVRKEDCLRTIHAPSRLEHWSVLIFVE